jgi:hypothetical protein
VEKLNAMRNSASTWQKQAIDRMVPLMRELAANTTAAINDLNEQRTRLLPSTLNISGKTRKRPSVPGRPLEPAQVEDLRAGRPATPMRDVEFPPHPVPIAPIRPRLPGARPTGVPIESRNSVMPIRLN